MEQFRVLEEVGDLFAPLAHEMAIHKERSLAVSDEMESLGFALPLGEGARVDDPDYPFTINAGRDSRLWGIGRRSPLVLGCDVTTRGWVRPSPTQDPSRRAFIECAFEQAIVRFPNSVYLKLCLLDFVAEADVKSAKKRCKGFLKADRNNLALLCRYAELEAASNNHDDAWRVFETALAMGQAEVMGVQQQTQSYAPFVRLCRCFATLLVDHGRRDRAAAVLAACAGEPWAAVSSHEGPLPPTTVARARAMYERSIAPWAAGGALTAAGRSDSIVFDALAGDLVACRVLFEYCTVGFESTVEVYERVASQLEARERSTATSDHERLECERMRESAAVLAHWHCARQREASGPALLRRMLLQGLEIYPANTTLLTLFISGEARSRIAGRVRAWFAERTRSKRCSVPVYLFAMYAELSQVLGASEHRIRATLRSFPDNPIARRCPLLWRMRLEFERARSSPDAAVLARSVFYQAVQNCPGVKSIYLDGPSRVPSLFQEAVDILQEKGLHLRTPLEEIEILGLGGDRDARSDGDDEEDEVDAVAAMAAAASRAAEEDARHDAAEAAHAADARLYAQEMHAWVDSSSTTRTDDGGRARGPRHQ